MSVSVMEPVCHVRQVSLSLDVRLSPWPVSKFMSRKKDLFPAVLVVLSQMVYQSY